MAPTIRPQSQKATRTLRTASPDQPLNVQEFLRSLKKRRRPLPTPTSLGAHPEPAEGSNHQPDASTYHKDFSYVDLGVESILPNEHFYDGRNTPPEQPALRESPSDMCAKKLNLVGSLKRKRQPLADVEQVRKGDQAEDPIKDDEDDEIDLVMDDTRKTRRKKRRAPVNELPLVKTSNESLPSRTASPMDADVRISLG